MPASRYPIADDQYLTVDGAGGVRFFNEASTSLDRFRGHPIGSMTWSGSQWELAAGEETARRPNRDAALEWLVEASAGVRAEIVARDRERAAAEESAAADAAAVIRTVLPDYVGPTRVMGGPLLDNLDAEQLRDVVRALVAPGSRELPVEVALERLVGHRVIDCAVDRNGLDYEPVEWGDLVGVDVQPETDRDGEAVVYLGLLWDGDPESDWDSDEQHEDAFVVFDAAVKPIALVSEDSVTVIVEGGDERVFIALRDDYSTARMTNRHGVDFEIAHAELEELIADRPRWRDVIDEEVGVDD